MRAVSVYLCLSLMMITLWQVTGLHVDQAIDEAKQKLEGMKERDWDNTEEKAQQDIEQVVQLLEKMRGTITGTTDNMTVASVQELSESVTRLTAELKISQQVINLYSARDKEKKRNFWMDVTSEKEYQFNGTSFLAVNSSDTMEEKGSIAMFFKTGTEDGLIFAAFGSKNTTGEGNTADRDKVSIEMKGGHVVFQYTVEGVTVSQQSDDGGYNDSEWHTVSARRQGQQGTLYVDDTLQKASHMQGSTYTKLKVTSPFYYGGLPEHEAVEGVTRQGFNGSLKQAKLGSEDQNLNVIDLADNILSCKFAQSLIISTGTCQECGNECTYDQKQNTSNLTDTYVDK